MVSFSVSHWRLFCLLSLGLFYSTYTIPFEIPPVEIVGKWSDKLQYVKPPVSTWVLMGFVERGPPIWLDQYEDKLSCERGEYEARELKMGMRIQCVWSPRDE